MQKQIEIGIPSSLRRINRDQILKQLLRNTQLSRADLAKNVGVSPVTTGRIVDDLLAQKILEPIVETPVGGATLRVGRPGRLVRLDTTLPRFVVMQVGVVHTRLAAIPLGFRGPDKWQAEFETPATPEAWRAEVKLHTKALRCGSLWGVLMSIPGIVDEAAGRVLFAPNLHWLETVNLLEIVQGVFHVPATLVQEIRALALGEMTSHPERTDFLLADFGHGVGGAAMLHGQVFEGALPLSVELGHTPVKGNTRKCGCGGVGCVETLVSRRGLFESLPRKGAAHYSWPSVAKHIQEHGVEEWLRESLRAVAQALATAMNVLGVSELVVTGGLAELGPEVRKTLADEIRAAAMWARFGKVTCHFSERHRMRGLIRYGIERLLPDAE